MAHSKRRELRRILPLHAASGSSSPTSPPKSGQTGLARPREKRRDLYGPRGTTHSLSNGIGGLSDGRGKGREAGGFHRPHKEGGGFSIEIGGAVIPIGLFRLSYNSSSHSDGIKWKSKVLFHAVNRSWDHGTANTELMERQRVAFPRSHASKCEYTKGESSSLS